MEDIIYNIEESDEDVFIFIIQDENVNQFYDSYIEKIDEILLFQ